MGAFFAGAAGALARNPPGWFILAVGGAMVAVAAPIALAGYLIKRYIDGADVELYWKIDTADGIAPKGASSVRQASTTGSDSSPFSKLRKVNLLEGQPFFGKEKQ